MLIDQCSSEIDTNRRDLVIQFLLLDGDWWINCMVGLGGVVYSYNWMVGLGAIVDSYNWMVGLGALVDSYNYMVGLEAVVDS